MVQAVIYLWVIPSLHWHRNFCSYWLITYEKLMILVIAGLFLLAIGFWLFCLGLVFLAVGRYLEKKINKTYSKKHFVNAFAILLVNFPVAGLVMYLAGIITSIIVITVANHSAFEITDFTLEYNKKFYPLPSIDADRQVNKFLRITSEGSVQYAFTLNGTRKQGIAVGYVAKDANENVSITITKDLSIVVDNSYNRALNKRKLKNEH